MSDNEVKPMTITDAVLVQTEVEYADRFKDFNIVRFDNPKQGQYKTTDGQIVQTVFFDVKSTEGESTSKSIGEILAERMEKNRYSKGTKGELLEFKVGEDLISFVCFAGGYSSSAQLAKDILEFGFGTEQGGGIRIFNKGGFLNTDTNGKPRRLNIYVLGIIAADLTYTELNRPNDKVASAYWQRVNAAIARLGAILSVRLPFVLPKPEKSYLTLYFDPKVSAFSNDTAKVAEEQMEELDKAMKGVQNKANRKRGMEPFTVNHAADIFNDQMNNILYQLQTQ